MANKLTIQHKRSSVSGSSPTAGDIAVGELAINFADAKLFTKDGGGNIIELGGSGVDTFVNAASIDANNLVTLTRSDGNTVTLDLDGIWVETPTTAPTDGQVLTWNNTNGAWEAATLPSGTGDTYVSGVAIDSADLVTFTRSDGNTSVTVDLSSRWLSLANGGTVAGNTVFSGVLQTTTAPTAADDVTSKSYVDALVANSDIHTASAAIDANNLITFTRNDTTTYSLDLGTRFAESVNGIVPDANGNIAVAITSVATGTLANRTSLTPAEGDVYVVSGDANTSNDGRAFIYNVDDTTWYEISPPDQAANDARYTQKSGDTLTGALTLAADPTTNLQAATKQYVDNLVSNSEVYTSNATFDSTTGNLTQTRTDGTTYVESLDGRYVIEPSGASNGQVLVWNGTAWEANTAGGSNWTVETSGISRLDRIKVGANADPLVAVDVVGTVGQNTSAGPAIDASAGQVWTVDSSTNPTVTISGTIPSSTTVVCVVSGGGTVTWPAAIKWPGGTAPSWSIGTDVVTLFTSDAGTTWYGNSFVLDAQ